MTLAFSNLAGEPVPPGDWSWAVNVPAGGDAPPMTRRVLRSFGGPDSWSLVCGPVGTYFVTDVESRKPVYCGTAGFRDYPLPSSELFHDLRVHKRIPSDRNCCWTSVPSSF